MKNWFCSLSQKRLFVTSNWTLMAFFGVSSSFTPFVFQFGFVWKKRLVRAVCFKFVCFLYLFIQRALLLFCCFLSTLFTLFTLFMPVCHSPQIEPKSHNLHSISRVIWDLVWIIYSCRFRKAPLLPACQSWSRFLLYFSCFSTLAHTDCLFIDPMSNVRTLFQFD